MNMAMANPETLISVRGLTVGFGGPTVLENIDLDIYRGEIVAIVGGSGTGKTVLMRSILGLVRCQSGSIEAFGMPVTDMDSNGRLENRWGVLFQQGALFSSLTVAQNVALYDRRAGAETGKQVGTEFDDAPKSRPTATAIWPALDRRVFIASACPAATITADASPAIRGPCAGPRRSGRGS